MSPVAQVRVLYNVSWDDPALYDVTLNASHMTMDASIATLQHMAQQTDFRLDEDALRTVNDLLLAARCRLRLGEDERTRSVKAAVRAAAGRVSVTYPPWQGQQAQFIPHLLQSVEGLRSCVCTVATSNILFIQERFEPDAKSVDGLLEVAEKWNAAVALLRLADKPDQTEPAPVESAFEEDNPGPYIEQEHGGILDDEEEDCEAQECGLPQTLGRLIKEGRAGAARTVYGGAQALVESLSPSEKFNLVVVGDVFLRRGEAVSQRLQRDLIGLLADRLRVPVISSKELSQQYLFGARQWLSTVGFAVLSALIYLVVFTNQQRVLEFLTATGTGHRILATALVLLFVPAIAFVVGGFAHNICKLAKLE